MNAVVQENFPSGNSPRAPFLDWLVAEGQISGVLAERVVRVQEEAADRLGPVLLKLGLLSEAAFADLQRRFYNAPAVADSWDADAFEPMEGLNSDFLRSHGVFLCGQESTAITAACWDATDDSIVPALQFATGRRIDIAIATRAEIEKALQGRYPPSIADIQADAKDSSGERDALDRMKDLVSDAPIIRLTQRLLEGAIDAKASDIHIEGDLEEFNVRYRLDGMLRMVDRLTTDVGASVVSRIKVIAGMDIAERRLPQDGRLRATIAGKQYDFRVASSPTIHGESVVLRVLDRQDVQLNLEGLGLAIGVASAVRRAAAKPHGILLVTGPTGSGKTTTLYAALRELNSAERKVLTIEDPVEYQLPGVNQVPVRSSIGLTFAHALRAFLRQDPDVLLVGEIRDRETAEIAVQAALTGHLLLSTLHTNSAASAIVRLRDMGIDAYLLTSTLSLIVGQRLVRRLCTCKVPLVPSETVLAHVGCLVPHGADFYGPHGCNLCNETGYRGRTAIAEILELSEPIREAILAGDDAGRIQDLAQTHGMLTIRNQGLALAAEGVTSLDEVIRVTSTDA